MNGTRWWVLAVLGWALIGGSAHAQSFRLDRFRAAERPDDGFAVRRLEPFGHLRAGVLASADYAHAPLIIGRGRSGRTELQKVVEHQLTLKLDLSLALWERVILLAGLDVVALSQGPSVPPGFAVPEADGAGLGDLALGARLRLVGAPDDRFALGLQAVLIAPTAGDSAYRGERTVAARPELIAELRARHARVSLNLGSLVRQRQRVLDARLASELVYGAGVAVPVAQWLELLGELWGAFSYADFARRATTDCEWLLGARFRSQHGLYVRAGAGTAFTRGVGSPDARAVVQLGYLSPARRTAAPAADRDRDGVLDASDACPREAEDADQVADGDGCPELDNDRDGVLDVSDACPVEAEDADGFADTDGCPERDNDQDAVPDADDACPDVKGVVEARGCPPEAGISEAGELTNLEDIRFENNQATILPESFPILEAVRQLLERRPEIVLLRIEGHTDTVGQDPPNLLLSQARAASVGSWLVEHGVEAVRLRPYGCGERHPIADDQTEQGRALNRRVVFQVVGPDTAEVPAGCRAVKLKAP